MKDIKMLSDKIKNFILLILFINTNYIPIIPHLKQNICHFLHFTN